MRIITSIFALLFLIAAHKELMSMGIDERHEIEINADKEAVQRLLEEKIIESVMYWDEQDIWNEITCCLPLFVEYAADINKGPDRLRGWTLLHSAAKHGKSSIVKSLLEQSTIKIDTVDCMNVTPLMMAAREGHTKVIKMLLKAGACTDIVDECGMVAWDHAYFAEVNSEKSRFLLNNFIASSAKDIRGEYSVQVFLEEESDE